MIKMSSQSTGAKMDFYINDAETTCSHFEKDKLGLYLTLRVRINSKWFRDLNAKLEIIQVVEET